MNYAGFEGGKMASDGEGIYVVGNADLGHGDWEWVIYSIKITWKQ